jgi:hypothetical protein
MYLALIAMAGVAALVAALIAWAMVRRYGRRRALVVPVLAVAASVVSVMRVDGMEESDLLVRAALAMGFAGPAVAGALVGLALAGRKDR